jgi:predicted DNA-binding WGR domain protein
LQDQLSYISGVTRRCWHACIDGAAEPAGEAVNGLTSIQVCHAALPRSQAPSPHVNYGRAGAGGQADISPGEHVCLEKCMQKVKEFQDQSATVLAQENERIAERNRRQAAAA